VHPPTLVQYDQWGRRIDHLQTSEGWRELKAISQREGLPGIFYERKHNEYSRTYGFAKVALLVGDTNQVRLVPFMGLHIFILPSVDFLSYEHDRRYRQSDRTYGIPKDEGRDLSSID